MFPVYFLISECSQYTSSYRNVASILPHTGMCPVYFLISECSQYTSSYWNVPSILSHIGMCPVYFLISECAQYTSILPSLMAEFQPEIFHYCSLLPFTPYVSKYRSTTPKSGLGMAASTIN
jgi:hypothetical protein